MKRKSDSHSIKEKDVKLLEGPMFLKPKATEPIRSAVSVYQETTLFPILTAETLLSNTKIAQLLTQIAETVNIPADYYQETYYQLIQNFAEYVQVQPVYYGGQVGELLFEGLKRSLLAAQIQNENTATEFDPVYMFAVFSAGLLLDLNKLLLDRDIYISGAEDAEIRIWSPFEGSMLDLGEHYQLRNADKPVTQLSPYLTIALALQVLPQAAYLWLAEDIDVLNMWFAALCGDESGAGSLGRILGVIKKRFEAAGKERFFIPVDTTEPSATKTGEAFWLWLKKGLADGSIGINQKNSYLHILKNQKGTENEAFLEYPAIFREFAGENWESVYREFKQMQLTGCGDEDLEFTQVVGQSSDAKHVKQAKTQFTPNPSDQQSSSAKSGVAIDFFNRLSNDRTEAAKAAAIKQEQTQAEFVKQGVIVALRKFGRIEALQKAHVSKYLHRQEQKKVHALRFARLRRIIRYMLFKRRLNHLKYAMTLPSSLKRN